MLKTCTMGLLRLILIEDDRCFTQSIFIKMFLNISDVLTLKDVNSIAIREK